MCGFAAIGMSDLRACVNGDALRRMTRALRHRGPDGEGFHVDGPAGLGHRRLSIIDLQSGSQPMHNEDGRLSIAFNGEIYNYRELATELAARGHQFRTHSDTEVILHLYEDCGPRCLDALNGIFAFAIWDSRGRTLFAARDRLGIKPLFYAVLADRIVLASELKALLEDPDVPRELDVAALDDYLAYGYVPGDRCILKGVHKLAPGHWLRWHAGQIEIGQYWDVRFAGERGATEREWSERLESVLRRAVELQLRADVPLGVFLSGGVDSSAITAFASRCLDRPVKTFSVGFRESDYDEMEYARLVAARYQTEHTEIVVGDRDISVLSDLAWYLDEPFADPSALPTHYVCREARKHVTVCLSGDGGDEIFAGYSRYAQARSYARCDWVPAGVRRAVGSAVLAATPTQLWGRGLIERISHSGANRYFAQMSAFDREDRCELLGGEQAAFIAPGARCFEPFFANANGHDLVTILQHIDQKNYLPDDILVKTDRMSMQHGLEVRVPLLDHNVVEAVNAAPASLKLRGGVGKYIFKKLLEPHLPPEILHRRKMGFGIPIKHWFRGSLGDTARELLLAPSSRGTRYLDRRAVETLLAHHNAGMRDFSRKIWTLLVFEHWCRRYGF